LTGEDVTGLDLLETQLVVLSACEAGSGPHRFGAGLLAFRRAFVLAGARTVVTSLWRIPGPARLVLLERFYQNMLKRGMARGEALREAQQYTRGLTLGQLRRSAVGELVRAYLQPLERQADDFRPFRHPRYWGAFICQGETGPLPTS
jgi:CHAT domain-containing protein